MSDLPALREAARAYLASAYTKPVATQWRVILGDTERLTDVGPVCADPTHPGYPDIGIERDDTGLYDCCPPAFEVWSDAVAAYLVALLNADADAAGNDGDEEITCARLHCPARVWFRHAEASGWHPLPMGSWYCPDEHVPGGRSAAPTPGGE
jgi:hypothetical protein